MPLKYNKSVLLFENQRGKFVKLNSGTACEAFGHNYPARGLAVGNLDHDGFPGVAIADSGTTGLRKV